MGARHPPRGEYPEKNLAKKRNQGERKQVEKNRSRDEGELNRNSRCPQ